MQMETLKDLYVEELRDIYNAEQQLIKALPKMAKAATSEDLRDGFSKHLEQTRTHAQRLEQIFKQLGESAKGKKCAAMEGLIEEGSELIEEDPESDVLDVGLICAAQKVEHYEIASYGCVRTYARLLGNEEAAQLLQTTLDEEAQTDKDLTALSENLNVEAINAGGDDNDKDSRRRDGHGRSKSEVAE